MYQVAGHLEYQNRRIVNVTSTGDYRGVTHEFLNIESAGCVSLAEAHFIDHADGANRPEKFKRDIKLLKGGLKAEPKELTLLFLSGAVLSRRWPDGERDQSGTSAGLRRATGKRNSGTRS